MGYLVNGQGGWGVWCRGAGPGELYAFNLTHGGAAEIRTPTGTTGFRFVDGLDTYRPNRLRADCTDMEVGGSERQQPKARTPVDDTEDRWSSPRQGGLPPGRREASIRSRGP